MKFFSNLFKNKQLDSLNRQVQELSSIVLNLVGNESKNVEKEVQILSPKDQATQNRQPWFDVLKFELDSENESIGAFTLDWNEYHISRLIKAGYSGKNDQEIINAWFNDICRNILMESYESYEAQPMNRRKNLGDGKVEIS